MRNSKKRSAFWRTVILFMVVPSAIQAGALAATVQLREGDEKVIDQYRRLFPDLVDEEELKFLRSEPEEFGEAIGYFREMVDEYNSIRKERGTKAARLWKKLIQMEHEVEQLIEEADGEPEDKQLHRMVEKLVKADIAFHETESKLLEHAGERTELMREIASRRANVEEEVAEWIEEFHHREAEEHEHEFDEESELLKNLSAEPVKAMPAAAPTKEMVLSAGRWNFESKVLPRFESHCFDCHGGGSDSGNLDIESLLNKRPLVKNRERWENVIAQIENRTMPPPDSADVSDEDRKVMSAALRHHLEHFDYSSIQNPGFENAKRLTHEEYNHTIRDLVGIDLRPADRLPPDLTARSGFDNSANSLFLHANLLEKYVGLAENVVVEAWPKSDRSESQQRAWNNLFVANPSSSLSEKQAAGQIFARWLPRVYRSSIEPDEIDVAVERFTKERQRGKSFEEAILECVQRTLVSPRFLLRVEATKSESREFPVDQFELANRLSYFLWASMPDEQLFQHARNGQLADSVALHSEIERMIRDPKSDSLGRLFAGQWLGFEHLGTRIRLDPIDNPWCTDSLMGAMRSESAMSFVYLIRENRRLHELVDTDYTFLNEELASYYQIDGVRGEKMRRVKLHTDVRGGIFGQSSLLAVTSFPDRTSPVMRGTWILDNVLGKRPPSPPPNASQLAAEIEEHDFITPKQKMQLHRQNPNCAACHDKIDPLGFALENYDLFGRYRTRSDGREIDASAQLPDGTEFVGPGGLKQFILDQRLEDLLTQLTRKMLAYALGRQIEYYDEATVQSIVAAVRKDDYRMRTLVTEVATSYPFLKKRVQVE